MLAIDALYDGGEIHLRKRPSVKRCPVIVIFQTESEPAPNDEWHPAQANTLQKIWDNEEDAAYDNL